MKKTLDYYIDQLINHTDLFDTDFNSFDSSKTFNFSDETILITGAAGTIGKELTKQLLRCNYKKLVLVDIAESSLYNLSIEFKKDIANPVEFRVANINDLASTEHLFKTCRPSIVIHCAANKHVPLMEQMPYEAVKTNVLATKQLADLSVSHKVKKFIFISSDKAVNPVSIMGMTKRISENYLNAISKGTETQFIITRFGNILGSNGSVLPTFLKQIELNIPLTITDNEMTRFFISKEKSCQLILESISINENKINILIFKNSNPIKIKTLANKIISISENPNTVINITGIRKGEKLHEQMFSSNEKTTPTSHKDIFKIESKKKSANCLTDLNELQKITPYHSTQEVEVILKQYL